jgi:hypothetical protein
VGYWKLGVTSYCREACELFENSALTAERKQFALYLQDQLNDQEKMIVAGSDLLSDFLLWCSASIGGACMSAAIAKRKMLNEKRLRLHKELVHKLWLRSDPVQQAEFWTGLDVELVAPLQAAYPPLGESPL